MFFRCYLTFSLLLLLGGCGVSTDSSSGVSLFTSKNLSDVNTSDKNSSVDTNSTVDSNSSDGNTTSGVTTPNDPNAGTVPDANKTIFDSTDAVFDADACNSASVSADPLQDSNVNSDREKFDTVNGIKVQSLYPETFDELDSLVSVYYNKFPTTSTLKDDRTLFYGDNSRYYVGYDLAWLDVTDAFVYIKIPKLENEKQSCYKLTLDKEQGTDATAQKVYR